MARNWPTVVQLTVATSPACSTSARCSSSRVTWTVRRRRTASRASSAIPGCWGWRAERSWTWARASSNLDRRAICATRRRNRAGSDASVFEPGVRIRRLHDLDAVRETQPEAVVGDPQVCGLDRAKHAQDRPELVRLVHRYVEAGVQVP